MRCQETTRGLANRLIVRVKLRELASSTKPCVVEVVYESKMRTDGLLNDAVDALKVHRRLPDSYPDSFLFWYL